MFDEIDSSTVVAEIVLLRAAEDKAIVIVEGPSDENFISNYVDFQVCDIVISHGRDNSLGAMRDLDEAGICGVLAIVDVDCGFYIANKPIGDDFILTDECDIEIMLVNSGSFRKLLTELGSRTKLRALGLQLDDVRSEVFEAAFPLGLLRLHSLEAGLNLKFKKIRFRFVDRRSLEIDILAMVREVLNNTGRANADPNPLVEAIRHKRTLEYDKYRLCCGHDIAEILRVGLHSRYGSTNLNKIDGEDIESRLRSGYETQEFCRTRVFSAILRWEEKNTPYRIFRREVVELYRLMTAGNAAAAAPVPA